MSLPAEEFLTYEEWEYVSVLIAHDVTMDLAAGRGRTADRHRPILVKVTNIMAQLESAAEGRV